MRILKPFFAACAVVVAICAGLFAAGLMALAATFVFLARRVFGIRRATPATGPFPPKTVRPVPKDTIDVVATEVTADRPSR